MAPRGRLATAGAAPLLRPKWVVCHEHRGSTPGCVTVREMKEGPSGSVIRSTGSSRKKSPNAKFCPGDFHCDEDHHGVQQKHMPADHPCPRTSATVQENAVQLIFDAIGGEAEVGSVSFSDWPVLGLEPAWHVIITRARDPKSPIYRRASLVFLLICSAHATAALAYCAPPGSASRAPW